MTVSKKFKQNWGLRGAIVATYQTQLDLTVEDVGKMHGVDHQAVGFALKEGLTPSLHKRMKAMRYSASKTGPKNPMSGKSGSQHHGYKGVISDGHGYATEKQDGKYVLHHRKVMANLLGIEELPPELDVHHIDKNPLNNSPDNLALVTRTGHATLHKHLRSSEQLESARSRLRELGGYGTSKSPWITAT